MILGSESFVGKIRSLRAGVTPHKEVPQQNKVMNSIDAMGVAKEALSTLGREIEAYLPGQRVRGEAKEDRDVVVYALWEKAEIGNEEIGRLFGVSYSAVSHIVRDVKERIFKDPRLAIKVNRINSQFKM